MNITSFSHSSSAEWLRLWVLLIYADRVWVMSPDSLAVPHDFHPFITPVQHLASYSLSKTPTPWDMNLPLGFTWSHAGDILLCIFTDKQMREITYFVVPFSWYVVL